MATIKTSLVEDKINELTASIKAMTARVTDDPTNPTYIAKSTKQTQLYHMKRERRVLRLIASLIALNPDAKLSQEDQETFSLITTLASERTTTKYQFAVGDDIYELMVKYPNLSRDSLEKKLEKLNLKADFATGKVIKA